MKRIFIYIILSTVFLAGSLSTSIAQTPEEFFQKGLIKEQGEGNLQEAIDLYNRIADNSSAGISLRAKALLHVGMCYEKLGKQEAAKAYQRLVSSFPSQKDEVAIARERLSKLILDNEPTTPPHLANKKIWEDQDVDDSGEISPEGKFLSYNDWNTGNLAVYEIATGEKRLLTNINPGQGSNYDQFAFSPKWAPDGKSIYYAQFISPDLSELRCLFTDNSTPVTICKINGRNKWLEVHDLSSDGKTVLTTIESVDSNTTQIALVSVSSGKINIVKEFPSIFIKNLIFTNNDSKIIFDYPSDLSLPEHDIFILSIDGKNENILINHPSNDFVLGVSPDERNLLFASTRSGNLGFWSIELKNGKTQGSPVLIKTSEYPYLKGLGFSNDGAFYYSHFPSKTDVYETEINPETGMVIIPPHEIANYFIGANSTPDYSPDGKYMAFVSRRSPFNARQTYRPVGNILCIKSLDDSRIREINPEISNFGFPKWSPDNNSVLVVNWEADNKMGLYKIDIKSGKSNLILQGDNQAFNGHEWCQDGKSVYLVKSEQSGKQKIVKHNIESGNEKILFEGTWKELTNISPSPDGKLIAFMGRDSNRSLKVIPSEGGEIREIYCWDQGDNAFIFFCWGANGKYIYLSKLREPKNDQLWDIWQIPMDGSKPKSFGLELTNIWQICAHPDGKHLAYSNQGSAYKMPEVWMMENFLPSDYDMQKIVLSKKE